MLPRRRSDRGTHIVSSDRFLLAGRFGRSDMSMDGNFCWKDIIVGVCWDLMCRICSMSFFVRNLPWPPPPPPTEHLNFVLWPHPNWPEVPGDTSAENFKL